MTHCTRCGRTLKNPGINGMGPICAKAMYGTKPRRVKSEPVRDEKTPDLFAVEFDARNATAGGIGL